MKDTATSPQVASSTEKLSPVTVTGTDEAVDGVAMADAFVRLLEGMVEHLHSISEANIGGRSDLPEAHLNEGVFVLFDREIPLLNRRLVQDNDVTEFDQLDAVCVVFAEALFGRKTIPDLKPRGDAPIEAFRIGQVYLRATSNRKDHRNTSYFLTAAAIATHRVTERRKRKEGETQAAPA